MKLQEVDRSATVAWSPSPQYPSFLASGTVAGSLDVDFDTSAHLEIFSLDFSDNGKMTVVGKTSASDRFTKLCWGMTGTQSGVYPRGLLAGGLANGIVNIWDPAKIIGHPEDNEEALIASCERHTSGPVPGLDFNPFQHNLLASGGSDSEIFIWDLQNPKAPTVYNPGAKTQVYQDSGITCVAWNRKVQHILGSTNYSGVTVIWDLKAKRAVLNFNSPNRKLRCKSMAWNPDEATQVVTASEDDSAPIIELWDLRNTYSPFKTLEGHTRGIWSLSWCPMDSDLLLSCGKDNRTLCWNVKTGEIQSEVEVNSQTWNFDVQWSPRVPAILTTCSLERKISVYSVQDVRNGGGGVDKSLGPLGPQKSASNPPKWLKRPVGVSFGFGGKIAWFKRSKPTDPRTVCVSQVVTDQDFLARADRLEEALASNDLQKYCEEKVAASKTEEEKSTWTLMRLLFEQTPRSQLLQQMGYSPEQITSEIQAFIEKSAPKEEKKPIEKPKVEEENKEEEQTQENRDVSGLFDGENSEETNLFETISQQKPTPVTPYTPAFVKDSQPIQFVTDGPEGMITKALIIGNFEAAVECCIRSDRMADALVLAAYGGPELWKKTQEAYFNQKARPFMKVISSIVREELRDLVDRADLSQWKGTLAVICTYAKREEFAILCGLLGERLLSEVKDEKSATQCFICAGNIDRLLPIWVKEKDANQKSAHTALQALIEKVLVFRRAVNHKETLSESVAEKFSEYAQLLASQGRLSSAAQCLSFLTERKYEETTSSPFVLLYRIYHAQKGLNMSPPPFPFQKVTEVNAPIQPIQAVHHKGPAPVQISQQRPIAPVNPGYVPQPTHQQPTFTTPGGASLPHPSSTFHPNPSPVVHQSSHPPAHHLPHPPSTLPSYPPQVMQPGAMPVHPSVMQPSVMQPSVMQPSVMQPSVMQPGIMQPGPVSNPVQHGSPPITPGGAVPVSPRGVPPVSSHPSTTAPKTTEKPKEGSMIANTHLITKSQTTSSAPSGPTSSENQFIIDSLANILTACVNSQDPKVNKYAKDVQKRFEPMLEKLAKNDFSTSVATNIGQLCQAILNGDSRTAHNINVELTQKHWEELGSSLMIGLKRLLEMTKS